MQIIHQQQYGRVIIREGSDTIVFNMERIGRTIARLRKETDMTQMELAERMNVSFQAVSNWERGQSMPDIARLSELAAALGTTVDALLEDERAASLVGKLHREEDLSDVDLKTAGEAAPMLKPSQVEKIVDAQKAIDLSSIANIAPFLSDRALSRIVDKLLQKGGSLNDIMPIAPFLSAEDIDRLVEREYAKTHSLHDIASLAPFMSDDTLNRYADDALTQSGDLSSIASLAPFLPAAHLNELARKALEKHGLSALSPIMPFIDSGIVEEYIEKNL